MTMTQAIVDQLHAAMAGRTLVRITRPFDDGHVTGYVVAVGPAVFVLAIINDQIWLDGFEGLRLRDVQTIDPEPHAAFIEAALTARGEARPVPGLFDAATLKDLIASAVARCPLITLHEEVVDPDVCYVGQVTGVEGGVLWLLSIGPDADWDDDPLVFKLSDITRVSFGGDYEAALALVADAPPTAAAPFLRLVEKDG